MQFAARTAVALLVAGTTLTVSACASEAFSGSSADHRPVLASREDAPAPSSPLAISGDLEEKTTTGSADWPEWRGPGRDNRSREKDLLESWPEGGPALAWTARGLGRGFSSVAVAGARVFTMGDIDGSSHVIAIDREDGKVVWKSRVGKAGGLGGYRGPRSTPTFDDGRIYALGQYGDLVCLEAEDGDEAWRKNLVSDLGGETPGWGFAESVLVDGGRVICTPGGDKGTLAALDKSTGAVLWRSKEIKDGAQYSSLIPVEYEGKPQYIGLTMQSVFGVEPKTGKLIWRAEWPGETAVIPTPVFEDGLVYITSGYGVGSNVFRLGKDGEVRATYDERARRAMKNHHGGVVLVGDHIYGYSDGVGWACQELATGDLVWNEKRALGKGSITYADGHLYLREEGDGGTVVLIEASPKGWNEKGRFTPPDRSEDHAWAHPVVAGGKLFLRDQDVLLCYDVKKK